MSGEPVALAASEPSAYALLRDRLQRKQHTWLVTGVAGFIGSNLLETLLSLDQRVVGLDNFATGYERNLDEVRSLVAPEQWKRFSLIRGDIRNLDDCRQACEGAEHVLHHAALGSVPRSLADPITTNAVNIGGQLNMLVAARDAKVKSFTYAASSSTYGDHPALPKIEHRIGNPLSPYAVTKLVNEFYADVFSRVYGFDVIGLRYFNVFGRRQNPNGAYAAVIPKWASSLLKGQQVYINGDGKTSRDFCYVDNAVQANLLAATTTHADARNQVYNVAVSGRTDLNALFSLLRDALVDYGVDPAATPAYREFRFGDVRHSQADIGKASRLLGYRPTHSLAEGVPVAATWYATHRSWLDE